MRAARASARLCACAALWLARADVAAAAPAALQLEWTAPASCPQAADVRVRIEAALRRPTRVGGTAATRVQARVTADPRGFALVLETRAPAGGLDVRRMRDARCSVLADAAAVIVATAIDRADPDRAEPPPAGRRPPPADLSPGTAPVDLSPGTASPPIDPGAPPVLPDQPPASVPADPPAPDLSPGTAYPAPPPATDLSQKPAPPGEPDLPTPAPLAAPAPRLRGAVRMTGLGDLGSTPGLAGGLSGGLGLLGPRWRLDLAAVWVAPRPGATADPDVTITVGLLAAQLRGCAVPRLGALEFPVCLGLEAGAVRGRGQGDLATARTDWRPILSAVVGPALVWPFTRRLALVVQADLALALVRPRFAIAGLAEEVYRAPPATGRALIGVEVRFP